MRCKGQTWSDSEDRAWRKTFTRGNLEGEKKFLHDLRNKTPGEIIRAQKAAAEAKQDKWRDDRADLYYRAMKSDRKARWKVLDLRDRANVERFADRFLKVIPPVFLWVACLLRLAEKKTDQYFLHENTARFSETLLWDMDTGKKFSVKYLVI